MKLFILLLGFLFCSNIFSQTLKPKNESVPSCGPVFEKNKKVQMENRVKKWREECIGYRS